MSIVKKVDIGGQEIGLRASALIPRLYRAKFGRDMVSDMRKLQTSIRDVMEDDAKEKYLDVMDLTIFENVAWIMAWHYDSSIPEDPDEWLDSLPGVLSIYQVLPEIIELWGNNLATTSVPRKN